jgi:hypothetical protein
LVTSNVTATRDGFYYKRPRSRSLTHALWPSIAPFLSASIPKRLSFRSN